MARLPGAPPLPTRRSARPPGLRTAMCCCGIAAAASVRPDGGSSKAHFRIPGRDYAQAALYEAELLTEREVAELPAMWRRDFERAQDPRFTFCVGFAKPATRLRAGLKVRPPDMRSTGGPEFPEIPQEVDARVAAQRQDDPKARGRRTPGSLTRDGREGTVLLNPNAHGLPQTEANQPPPIALSDEQLDIIRRAAEPLHPHDRGAYLEAVAELLNGHELGDGVVARAAREAQIPCSVRPAIPRWLRMRARRPASLQPERKPSAHQFPTLRSEKNLSSRART